MTEDKLLFGPGLGPEMIMLVNICSVINRIARGRIHRTGRELREWNPAEVSSPALGANERWRQRSSSNDTITSFCDTRLPGVTL